MIYLSHVRQEIQDENPGASMSMVVSIAASQWKQLSGSQKDHYQKLSCEDR